MKQTRSATSSCPTTKYVLITFCVNFPLPIPVELCQSRGGGKEYLFTLPSLKDWLTGIAHSFYNNDYTERVLRPNSRAQHLMGIRSGSFVNLLSPIRFTKTNKQTCQVTQTRMELCWGHSVNWSNHYSVVSSLNALIPTAMLLLLADTNTFVTKVVLANGQKRGCGWRWLRVECNLIVTVKMKTMLINSPFSGAPSEPTKRMCSIIIIPRSLYPLNCLPLPPLNGNNPS